MNPEAIIISVLGIALTTVIGMIGYYFKKRDIMMKETKEHLSALDLRVNTLETTFRVLGDINATLTSLKLDIHGVKVKMGIKDEDLYQNPPPSNYNHML